jgi:opacity protein-like surface antigen
MNKYRTLAVIALLTPPTAFADNLELQHNESSNYYFKGGISYNISAGSDISVTDGSETSTGDTSGNFYSSFNAGFGYKVNNYYTTELMIEYNEDVNLSNDASSDVDEYGMTTEINYTSLFFNQLLDISQLVDKDWPIKPYLGAGLGVTYYDFDNYTLSYTPYDAQFVTSGVSGTNFSWKVMLGLEYLFSQHFSLDLAYAYSDYGYFSLGSDVDIYVLDEYNSSNSWSGSSGFDHASHELSVSLRYYF